MDHSRRLFLYLNVGHALDHLFMLLFPTVVLALEAEWNRPFSELVLLMTGGAFAFGAGALPAGWLGDRWNRKHMLTLFFIGTGGASILAGLATGPWTLAAALTLIGLFASIYHPVGVAMVVQGVQDVGRRLGINGVAGNLGVAAAALVAGALIDAYGWRSAFIVPGVVSIGVGLAFAATAQTPPIAAGKARKDGARGALSRALIRVFVVLTLATICGGVIFNATLVALPKVFAVRLDTLADSTFGVAGLVSIVYVFGAMAQVGVGYLLDRYSVRTIMMGVAGLQIPFLIAASQAHDLALVLVSGVMMLTIFGSIPVVDTLVARNTEDAWRARIYAIKYVLALGIGALAPLLVGFVYGATQDFMVLFGLFAVLSLLIVGIGSLLPKGGGPIATPEAALAPGESGD